ncbi:MAG TPA: TIGR02266 family protein [Polyangia bacterium]|nr:TIGR02266 family protein [Polyangia bacterium]
MAGQDSRVGDRQTASMRIKLKYPDIDTFIQKYAVNISRGGIFIATKSPKPVGTYVRFEFLLSDASGTSIIRGEGQVQWTKDYDPATPGKPHGMGVKFMRLDADSQTVVDRALRWRADHGTSPNVALPPTAPVSSAHMINTRDDFDRTSESPPLDQQVNDPERTARVNVPELLARTPKRELPPDEALDTERVDLPGMLARAAVDEQPKQESLEDPTARVGVPEAITGTESTERVSVPQLVASENEETVAGRESPLLARALPPPLPRGLQTSEGSLVGQLPARPNSGAPRSSPPPLPPDVQSAATAMAPMPDRRGETRPIAIEERGGRAPHETTREIALTSSRFRRTRDELDALAAEWGLTEERLQRALKRRRPRIAEATAELERLLLKPPKPPTPTIGEALTQLEALLTRWRNRKGTHE